MLTPRVLGPFAVFVLWVFVKDAEGIEVWAASVHLAQVAKTPVVIIDSMLLDFLRSSSFVPSWHRATHLSYSELRLRSHSCLRCEPTQGRGDGCWPSHSLSCRWLEFCDEISGEVHYWWRGSDGSNTWWRDRDVLRRCCIPPSTHRLALSTTSSVTMASNLMLKSCKDLSLGE
jgi:hypothetical protein